MIETMGDSSSKTKKRIKILHLIESLSYGGAERRLLNDLKYLDREKFEHMVCYLFGGGELEEELRTINIPVIPIPPNGKEGWFAKIISLYKIVQSFSPHILHTQLFYADILGRIVGKISRIPFIVTTIQSSVYEPHNKYLFSRKRKFLDKYTAKIVDGQYIAVSQFAKESFSDRLGIDRERIRVIYNSIDPERVLNPDAKKIAQIKSELKIQEDDIILLTVGRLDPPKGQQFVIQAMPFISDRVPNVRLFLVGKGPSECFLKKLVGDLGLFEKVSFLGERREVKELLAVSSLFILPTISEGLPLALLEAVFSKVPCIASNIPPIREIMSDNCEWYLFPPGDVQALSSKVIRVLENLEQANVWVRQKLPEINSKFSAPICAQMLETYYENLVSPFK